MKFNDMYTVQHVSHLYHSNAAKKYTFEFYPSRKVKMCQKHSYQIHGNNAMCGKGEKLDETKHMILFGDSHMNSLKNCCKFHIYGNIVFIIYRKTSFECLVFSISQQTFCRICLLSYICAKQYH